MAIKFTNVSLNLPPNFHSFFQNIEGLEKWGIKKMKNRQHKRIRSKIKFLNAPSFCKLINQQKFYKISKIVTMGRRCKHSTGIGVYIKRGSQTASVCFLSNICQSEPPTIVSAKTCCKTSSPSGYSRGAGSRFSCHQPPSVHLPILSPSAWRRQRDDKGFSAALNPDLMEETVGVAVPMHTERMKTGRKDSFWSLSNSHPQPTSNAQWVITEQSKWRWKSLIYTCP